MTIRSIQWLGVLMCCGVLVACGSDTAPDPQTTDAAGTSLPVTTETPTGDEAAAVTVFHNAQIHTMDEQVPQATAFAVGGDGKILALGNSDDLRVTYPHAQWMDLEGRTVLPGLIDAHGHLHGLAVSLTQAQLTGTTGTEEILSRLRAQAEGLGEDDWLVGHGWDQNDWAVKEFPSAADLDQAFPDRPVWLRRIDGHAAWANSAALSMVDQDLGGDWQPQGGVIHRDDAGQPTGIFIDGAMNMIDPLVPEISDDAIMAALDLAIQQLLSLGLTGVHEPGVSLQMMDRYERKLDQGNFPTRVYAMTDGTGVTLDWLCENGPVEHPSDRLFMRATKLYGDGALGSRGAALLADYDDEPGNQGLLFLQASEMEVQVDKVMGCGYQAAIHAIGDRANQVVLDALEAGMGRHPDNPGRHRVEHVQVLSEGDLPRFAQLGVIAAMQPTHATSDMYWAEQRLGAVRSRYAYAWRTLLDSGARLALGSDFPVEAVNPMLGLYAAVTRQDLEGTPEGGWFPEQRINRKEALRGFTLDAAYAAFMEDIVGSLAIGKRADFIVIDRDYYTVPAEEIAGIKVLETWMDGRQVYPR